MEAVIGSIPRSIDEPNSTSADEASREGENSNVISGSTSTQANDSASVRLHHKDISKVYTRRKFRPQPEATDLVPEPTSEQRPLALVHDSQQEVIDVSLAQCMKVNKKLSMYLQHQRLRFKTPHQMICPLHYEKVHEPSQECLRRGMGLNMI